MIYQPAAGVILLTICKARGRLPHLGSRLDKAAEMLADINSYLAADDHWAVRSSCNPGAWYTVTATTCTCADYAHHAPAAAPHPYYCKHLLFFHAYRRILVDDLNNRMIGSMDQAGDRRRAQLHTGSLVTDTRRPRNQPPAAVTYPIGHHIPTVMCEIRPDAEERWRPRTTTDFTALALWLDTVPPYAHPDPVPPLPDILPPAREANRDTAPLMTHNQYRRWLSTGDIPSMQELNDLLHPNA